MKIYIKYFFIVVCVTISFTQTTKALYIKHKKIYIEKIDDFIECAEKFSINDCNLSLKDFVKDDPQLNWKAAKIVYKNATHATAASYFITALIKNSGTCKDIEVQESILAGLQFPPSYELVKEAKKIAFQKCWNDWNEDIVNSLSTEGEYFRQNTCYELKKLNIKEKKYLEFCEKK